MHAAMSGYVLLLGFNVMQQYNKLRLRRQMMADAGLRSWRLQKLDHDETRAKQIEDEQLSKQVGPKTPIYLRR